MRFIFIVVFFVHSALAEEARVWTDTQDRKTEATFLKMEEKSVILKLKDGREVPYPLAKLSKADQEYLATKQQNLPAAELNFDKPWPELVKYGEDPEINVVVEDAVAKRFIYESANYRYVSDARLGKAVVKGFALLFEATHLYCRTLPLAFDGGTKKDGKFPIMLFENTTDYTRAGGPPGTAGVFITGRNVVLIPLESLGVKPVGSGYMLDRDKSSHTIPHELTHQLSPESYFAAGAIGWFSEGIAEYIAVTPYRSGTFNVRGNMKDITDYVTEYGTKDRGGRALGKEIHMPPMKNFMLQNYRSFQEQAQLGYGCGLMMTAYFLHMDGDGDGKRIKAFLKALRQGNEGEAALNILLDGRSYLQLQEEFTKAWSRKGIKFTFAKS